jgi:hypothetical protein
MMEAEDDTSMTSSGQLCAGLTVAVGRMSKVGGDTVMTSPGQLCGGLTAAGEGVGEAGEATGTPGAASQGHMCKRRVLVYVKEGEGGVQEVWVGMDYGGKAPPRPAGNAEVQAGDPCYQQQAAAAAAAAAVRGGATSAAAGQMDGSIGSRDLGEGSEGSRCVHVAYV